MERTRHFFSMVAVGGLTALGIVAGAPAAQADTVNVDVDCTAEVSFEADVNDTVVFTFLGGSRGACDLTETDGIWNVDASGADGEYSSNDEPGFLSTDLSVIYGADSGSVEEEWWIYASDYPTIDDAVALPTVLHGSTTRSGEQVNLAPDDVVAVVFLRNTYFAGYLIRWRGGSPPDSGSPAPVAATFTLSLEGATRTCGRLELQATAGTWLQLPSTTSCAPAETTSEESLLGWSTSATFPSSRAREQVDNGGGAIDAVINGQRMIFIQAGHSTLISGDNRLYPVYG